MSAATPLFSPTLESVQQAFDEWRATRGKRTRTPIALQRRAVALRDVHPASHICSALRINDTALKRWASELSPISPLLPAPSSQLVELPISSLSSDVADASTPSAHAISIDLGDAIQLRVQGCFTLEQILCAARLHQRGSHA